MEGQDLLFSVFSCELFELFIVCALFNFFSFVLEDLIHVYESDM